MKIDLSYINQMDRGLLLIVAALASVGLIMMSSASVAYSEHKYGDALFHFYRQVFYYALAASVCFVVFMVPTDFWYKNGGYSLLLAFFLLAAVLVLGREVNGSTRWIPVGPINLQASEIAKVALLVYLAGYLVRRQDEVKEAWKGFLKPCLVLMFAIIFLLLEPDFGSAVVLTMTFVGMLFLAGVGFQKIMIFGGLGLVSLVGMISLSAYRAKRLACFMNPWDDPYGCGYQTIQALIAFGRGEWLGLGLGKSIQKLSYLPEAHTDFVFAILAEELGFVGAFLTLMLFVALIAKVFMVARKAELRGRLFPAYLCYGVALMLSVQVFINIGVNISVLPNKGLTLPFLSYGGSSLISTFIMLGLVLRVGAEMKHEKKDSRAENQRGLKTV